MSKLSWCELSMKLSTLTNGKRKVRLLEGRQALPMLQPEA
jgi:hypothetical protein